MLEKIKRLFKRGDSFDDLKAGYGMDELFPETLHSVRCDAIIRAVMPSMETAKGQNPDRECNLYSVGFIVAFLRDYLEENAMLPEPFFKNEIKRKKLMAALQNGVVFLRSVKEIDE